MSLVAIGLAAHIQSLPAGAKVGIKVLTDRFPESEARITAALHELEAEDYLHRSRVRLPSGRMVTRTFSYNHPAPSRPRRPLQNCDTCERAFHVTEPGRCRDCRTEDPAAPHGATA
ncbi:hypothetical protein [Streptomyces sp. NPDC088131]|uniref:hypothetical protein n=1 Tax=Streptomyces sp. NPDC088131 TaxID=3365826 RepID=UPI003817D3DF